jgi:hypothetical protein
MCHRATSFIDSYCNQVLRATVDVEEVLGPNYRFTIDNNGLGRCLISRWPVIEILSAQWSYAASIPVQWNPIPTNAMFIEDAISFSSGVSVSAAAGPSAIRVAPGYLSWWGGGRNSLRFQATYVNGWAHAGIIGSSAEGTNTLSVDDCTGMVTGTSGQGMWIYDGSGTEYVTAQSTSVTTGPGTLTLTSNLQYSHNGSILQPVIISSLPSGIQDAAIMHATYQAAARGSTATTVQSQPGSSVSAANQNAAILTDIKGMLTPYKRVI